MRCFVLEERFWTGDGDGPHNLASPLSPLLCPALRGLVKVSSRSGAEKSLPTHRQTPTTPHQPGHWGLERDFTTSSCSLRHLAGRKSPAWSTSCDTPTSLTTSPFLCGTSTPSHSFTTKLFDSEGGCRHQTDHQPSFWEDISRERMDELRHRQQRRDLTDDQPAPRENTDHFKPDHRQSHIWLSNGWQFSTTNNTTTPIQGWVEGELETPAGGLGTASYPAHDNHYRRTSFFHFYSFPSKDLCS